MNHRIEHNFIGNMVVHIRDRFWIAHNGWCFMYRFEYIQQYGTWDHNSDGESFWPKYRLTK